MLFRGRHRVSRGAALIGEQGATVYVTGRTEIGGPPATLPGTVQETADEVTAIGGRGVPIACMAHDLRPHGVTAVSLHPGLVRRRPGPA